MSAPLKNPTIVEVYESERGWGQNHIETRRFATLAEAVEFVNKTNTDPANNRGLSEVPDWYVGARIIQKGDE